MCCVVQNTADPAALHVLDPRTLDTAHVVPGAALALFAHPTVTALGTTSGIPTSTSVMKDIHEPQQHVLITPVDDSAASTLSTHTSTHFSTTQGQIPRPQPQPQPVFALSHRLLAYASPAPLPHPRSPREKPPGMGVKTSTELGVAALRIGGSLLSGVRAVGGRAYEAARAAVEGASAGAERTTGAAGAGAGRFFSRSAPEASARAEGAARGRRYSTATDVGGLQPPVEAAARGGGTSGEGTNASGRET